MKIPKQKTPTRIITKIVNEFAHSDLFFFLLPGYLNKKAIYLAYI